MMLPTPPSPGAHIKVPLDIYLSEVRAFIFVIGPLQNGVCVIFEGMLYERKYGVFMKGE